MQFWNCPQSEEIDKAVREDFTNVLVRFTQNKKFAFTSFKAIWTSLGMVQIHNACPKRVKPVYFAHILFSNALHMLNCYPLETFTDNVHTSLKEMLWDIGVFYMLYVLFWTSPLEPSDGVRIRVSPEEWLRLLLTHERMKIMTGSFCDQAVKVFHKLLSVDAFQYALYSGIPSLHQLARYTRQRLRPTGTQSQNSSVLGTASQSQQDAGNDSIDVSDRNLASPSPPTLTQLLEGNHYVASNSEALVHAALSAGFSYEQVQRHNDDDEAYAEDGGPAQEGGMSGQAWSEAFADFFGSSLGGVSNGSGTAGESGMSDRRDDESQVSSDGPTDRTADASLHLADDDSENTGSDRLSILQTLELLEREAEEVLGDAARTEGAGSGPKGSGGGKKRSSSGGRKGGTTTTKRRKRGSGVGSSRCITKEGSDGGGSRPSVVGGSVDDMLAMLERDTREVLGEGDDTLAMLERDTREVLGEGDDMLAMLERETREVLGEGDDEEPVAAPLPGRPALARGKAGKRRAAARQPRQARAEAGARGAGAARRRRTTETATGRTGRVQVNSEGSEGMREMEDIVAGDAGESAPGGMGDILMALERATTEVLESSAET